jgi:YVTN family beta-propeller protein
MRTTSTTTNVRAIYLFLAGLLAVAGASSGAEGDTDRRIVREGIAVELEMEPRGGGEAFREGHPVTFRFRITDTTTGTPLSGVYPAAWMDLKPESERAAGYEECRDKVEAFIGGSLLSPPELDLNVYYVLALNQDSTISVVDPLFGFGTTKLLDMIFLDSPGEDWALSDDGASLFVTLPDSDRVAVADTGNWKVVEELDAGPRPSRLMLQNDGRYLWVSVTGGVAVIDVEGPSVVARIETGRGPHELAVDADDRTVFVTNAGDGTVSMIDVATLTEVAEVAAGREPVSVAYSSAAGAAYVSSRDGVLTAVDAGSREVVNRIETEPGLERIRFAPDGRLGFVVVPSRDQVHIVDAAGGRVVQTADVEDGPDQVTFSDHLAYVRHRGSEIVLMIPLDQVGREGVPVPVVDFPGGHVPFGKVSRPSPADGIVQAPGATAVLVANPADRAIYFYKEGMAAPMGQFQNYSREPRAVLAVDRSLGEAAPGSYETTATLRRPGRYDVAFFLDSPRTIHCFEVEVAPNPELEARRARNQPLTVEAVAAADELRAGEEVPFRFRLVDPASAAPRAGVDDLRVLTYRGPGLDARRQWARPVGKGVYEIDFAPPREGVYYLFVESASSGLRYNRSGFLVLQVSEPAASAGVAGR